MTWHRVRRHRRSRAVGLSHGESPLGFAPVGRAFTAPLRRRPSSGSLAATADQAPAAPVALRPASMMTADDSVDTREVLLVGLGDPVSDILVRLDDPSLASRVFDACGISEPGGCVPVDSDEDIKSLLAACGEQWITGAGELETPSRSFSEDVPAQGVEPTYCPGGSAANVAKAVANLGGDAAFVGMIGRDDIGARYRELLRSQKVTPVLLEVDVDEDDAGSTPRSAQCLSLVEKGGQRTMRTYLGASLRMGASHFDENVERLAFGVDQVGADDESGITKSSGRRGSSTWLRAPGVAAARGGLHAVPSRPGARGDDRRQAKGRARLPRPRVLRGCPQLPLPALVAPRRRPGGPPLLQRGRSRGVDRRDARAPDAFAREDAGRAMEWMLRYVRVATVSLGARGCVSVDNKGQRGVSPGVRCAVVDTTGAGDSFTGAFLWAYLRGGSLQACCSCGCAVGTAVVQVLGAELTAARWGSWRGTWRRCCSAIGNARVLISANGK